MSSEPHLRIFNGSDTVYHKAEDSFHLFCQLPKELRLKIWRASLKRERIIEISIDSPPEAAAAFKNRILGLSTGGEGSLHPETAVPGLIEGSSTDEEPPAQCLGNGRQFGAVVRGRNVLSKLLRVNREARSEACAFYRIRIPCQFIKDDIDCRTGKTTAPVDILLFNPEHDFLYLKPGHHPYQMTLAAFLVYLKISLDPYRVGLLNLALDLDDLTWAVPGQIPEPWDIWTQSARSTIAKTFENLEEVFLITTPSCRVGRQVFPFFSHGALSAELVFNRSTPLLAQGPGFSRVPLDPRPIERDLQKVYTSDAHPRTALRPWHALLKSLGATERQTRYSWLLSYEPSNYVNGIYSRSDAMAFVQREDDAWNGRVKGPSISDDVDRAIACGRASPDVRTKDLDKAARPAFGYWLFPLASGGTHEKSEKEEESESSCQLRDLSAYRPGLILTDLP